ncbi:MAG TPA: AI-2E family transporter [Bauldia sp.]|nr:AI-2E family transporter [Bauldia sp.]
MASEPIPADTEPPPAPIAMPRIVSVAIVGTFIILFVGVLYYARGFFLPLILALLVTLAFMPLVRSLARRGIPPVATAILVVIGIGAGAVGLSILLAEPTTRMLSEAPQIIQQLRDRFTGSGALSRLVEASEEVQAMAEGTDEPGAPQKVVIAQPGIISWAADTLSGIGGTLGATLLFVVFLLSSGDMFLQKLVRVLPTLSDKKRSLRVVHDVESEVSRYLFTITLINVGFGTAVGLSMAALGMPNPVLWGVGAALLNFVPYLGALVGMALAGAIGLITFPTLTMAALPPLAYFICNAIEGSIVTPLTLGRRLELNPVAILVALAFGGWMWGIVGALIGVPVLVVVKVFCDHFDSLATFGEFLSGEPVADPAHATENGTAGDSAQAAPPRIAVGQ